MTALPHSPGVHYMTVRHDPWCPMSYGEGTTCASGCNPVFEMVDEATMAAQMQRDFRNRAQRRGDARQRRRAAR